MNKVTYNFVGSTMKITASSKLDVTKDLQDNKEDIKTIAELLDEQEKKESNKTK